MELFKLRHRKVWILLILAIAILLGHSAYTFEMIMERTILNSVKEFNSIQMPLSFKRLWAHEVNDDIPYNAWQSIKNAGDRYCVNWSNLSFYDSYQETISRNGILYKCGVIIFKINNGEYASLAIMYLAYSNGEVINMRDNWSRELRIVPERAKDSLRSLVDKWLQER